MKDSLPNMDEVVRQEREEAIKALEALEHPNAHYMRKAKFIANAPTWLRNALEREKLLIEEREQTIIGIKEYEFWIKNIGIPAVDKVAERDKEIQALKDQNTVLKDKLDELESSLDICTRCEMTIIQE